MPFPGAKKWQACLVHACMLSRFSRVWLFATPWTIARQAPLSMGFSRQEDWSRLPFPPPGDLPDPGIKPASSMSLALADRFFTRPVIDQCKQGHKTGLEPEQQRKGKIGIRSRCTHTGQQFNLSSSGIKSWAVRCSCLHKGFPGDSVAVEEMWLRYLGREDPLEEGTAMHSSILAWRSPWTEEPGGPQSWGHRVRHDWATEQRTTNVIFWNQSGYPSLLVVHTLKCMSIFIFFFFNICILLIVDLQCSSYICTHILFFRLFSMVGYCKILTIIPWVIQ